jgi:uncharacterized membrane-anchored protein
MTRPLPRRSPRLLLPLLLAALAFAGPRAAAGQSAAAEQWAAGLGWQSGEIAIAHGAATLHFADAFRYLGEADAARVLTEAWGNPREAARGVVGMIFPDGMNPAEKQAWGIVVTFEQDGFVSDEGVEKLDFGELLAKMQEGARQSSAERKRQGFEAVELVGWAEPPRYDRDSHKLYWAKELRFGDSAEHTLNYSIRVLGRRGVLVLNAVSGMGDLERVKSEIERLLPRVDFNQGHRFADYVPGQDKVAEYGIAALIAGGAMAAVKAGALKWLIGLAFAFKKVLIVGAAGGAAAVRRLFGRKPEFPPNTPE